MFVECEKVLKAASLRLNIEALRNEFILAISDLKGFQIDEKKILNLVNLAKNAMQAGSYDLAISVLTNAIRQRFDYAESESYLGLGIL